MEEMGTTMKTDNNNPECDHVDAKAREEYFRELGNWFQNYTAWNQMNQCMFFNHLTNTVRTEFTAPEVSATANETPPPPAANANPIHYADLPDIMPPEFMPHAFEFVIPPLWKRFMAEVIDFMILFLLKITITFIAVDFFDIIDLSKYNLEVLHKTLQVDFKQALEMTVDVIVLELIHRTVVCAFEAYWLQGCGERDGGATPGKAMMGLKVITAIAIAPIPNRPKQYVLVYPATNLGFSVAFARSVMKNLIHALLFPICFVIFFFQYSRTGYDVMCNSLVVEDTAPPPIRN